MTLATRTPRAPRRAPSELTFTLDEADVDRWAAAEPDWLADDRRAAFARYRDLPIETNQLYTTYVDLRTADLGEVRPPVNAPGVLAGEPSTAPDGISVLASVVEDRVETLALDEEARSAGVVLETAAGLARRDPELARRLLADPASLPLDDKLAQLTRAGWTQGIVVHVPAPAGERWKPNC